MEEVKKLALTRALSILKATGCKYIVVDPEGVEHAEGGLQLVQPEPDKKRYKKPHRPYGALVTYYRPLIENMQVGDCVQIPFGLFEPEKAELASAISAWCATNWGPKTAMTHTTDTSVEVLRVA
jgi:hypothetical protein